MATRLRTQMAVTAAPTTAKPLIKRPANCKYKTLLTIDGGGIKGIIPAAVLRYLENSIKDHVWENQERLIPTEQRSQISSKDDFDVDLTDYFDLVAGTSIGSWIALYIAGRGSGADEVVDDPVIKAKYPGVRRGSMETAVAVFKEFGRDVFPRRSPILSRVFSVFRPYYPSDGLERSLKKVFGDSKFYDLETGCLITSFDLGKNVACSFLRDSGPNPEKAFTVRSAVRESTRMSDADIVGGQGNAGDAGKLDLDIKQGANFYVRDIAHASSAAPYFFRPATILSLDPAEEKLVLVDGGMVANNPTLQALTCAPEFFGTEIDKIAIFSVGCGTTDPEQSSRRDPGIGWWLRSEYLLDIFMEGGAEYIQGVMDFWLYRTLKLPLGQYVRIQRKADPGTDDGRLVTGMDRVEDLDELEALGDDMAVQNDKAIKNFVREYLFKPNGN